MTQGVEQGSARFRTRKRSRHRAAEVDLGHAREPARTRTGRFGDHGGGLAESVLGGDALQHGVRQSGHERHHRCRVAGEGPIGERTHDIQGKAGHHHHPFRSANVLQGDRRDGIAPLWSRLTGETPRRSVSRALAFGAALLLAPVAAQANVLLDGSFETTVTVAGAPCGFPVPAPPNIPDHDKTIGFQPWAASAHNGLGGIDGSACPAAFGFGCTGKGNWVATLESHLPSGVLPTPLALYQTVDLQAGADRFGGDFAMGIAAVVVGDNETEAFLPICAGGMTFDSFGVPSIAGGSLLVAIDLSPGRFAPDDFLIQGKGLSSVEKARQFQTLEGVFLLASDTLVTMEIVSSSSRSGRSRCARTPTSSGRHR